MFFFRRPSRESLPENVQQYLDAPRPDKDVPWREVSYTSLDIETSGLNPKRDSILAIGMIEIERGRVQVNRRWYTLVRPPEETLVGAESIRIHGILRADLVEAPPLSEVLHTFVERMRGRVMIVHVSSIDVKFLDRALQHVFGVKLRGPVLDTARFAGTLLHHEAMLGGSGDSHNTPRDTTLLSLVRRAKLPVHAQHNALGDALMTAQLFLWQAVQFEKQDKTTFQQLFRVGGSVK